MPVLAALLGAGCAAGVLLVAAGLAGVPGPQSRHRRQLAWSRDTTVRVAGCLAVAAVVGAATRWPVGAVLAGMAAWALPAQLGGDRAQRRATVRTEAVAAWTEMLRDNLGAAAGLEQAILAAALAPPAAIRDEVLTLAGDIRAGTRLPQALATFRGHLADPTGDLVVRALSQAANRQASKLADLLTELADLARKRTAVRLRVAAGRARVRTSARFITATTLAFAVGLVVLNRGYLSAYDSAAGQLVLVLIGGLFAVGFAGLTQPNPRRPLPGPGRWTADAHGRPVGRRPRIRPDAAGLRGSPAPAVAGGDAGRPAPHQRAG
jgi:Flp pilus assembly protein TadB